MQKYYHISYFVSMNNGKTKIVQSEIIVEHPFKWWSYQLFKEDIAIISWQELTKEEYELSTEKGYVTGHINLRPKGFLG